MGEEDDNIEIVTTGRKDKDKIGSLLSQHQNTLFGTQWDLDINPATQTEIQSGTKGSEKTWEDDKQSKKKKQIETQASLTDLLDKRF